ncbi:signal recognition particle subunit FFH/SRP54 (srp54) [Thermosyntropha lipolytica DSM 11003]|uniref:Signal recognition particle protein n=1 Tax=Thermosyntropha lipolytica DSM 11003 TaxID=1123382 RepID=A0A1M5QLW2_9FIRM|nr:signal recognition particle protein [Thermosyntropha lipolytica]SHH15062.1 signal recognition particle subunit FFH/SRP54 (srp54) [Thermosyntropha lipolytica DSM 11003]
MAFEGLTDRLQDIFRKLRGKGKITEEDVKVAMREVRLALLEADVNFKVVKDFINRVKDRAVGQEVLQSLTPGQQIIKIVYDEMTELMGGKESKLNLGSKTPSVIMAVGLQGAGKTTTVAKLAKTLVKQGRRPLLVACDVYRPAAIKQLQVLGEQIGVPVFSMGQNNPVDIARASLHHAKSNNRDIVILDTAGRLHINEELMEELKNIKEAVNPDEILLVVDAMTGQDAVNVAEAFNNDLGLTGVILTKLDGDTRGGAALSVKAVTGCPIKYVGMGEKLDALEVFHPDRMASRILGMGDILTLVEKAQASFDEKKAREMERKIRKQEFTLEDFLEQMQQVRAMGPLEEILGMIPGLGKQLKGMKAEFDEKELAHIEAIIKSMTPEERRNPEIINGSRKKRIARGSGTRVQDVNRLLKQFEESRKLMKQITDLTSKKGKKGGLPPIKFPF